MIAFYLDLHLIRLHIQNYIMAGMSGVEQDAAKTSYEHFRNNVFLFFF